MPYVPQSIRTLLDEGRIDPKTPGELNYLITDAALAGKTGGQIFNILQRYSAGVQRYHVFNEVVGAIECASLEFKRRFSGNPKKMLAVLQACKEQYYEHVVAPYEDLKIKENGDVYPNGD